MADLETAGNIAAHGAGAIGSGGLGAYIMHFFKSRQEQEERKERQALDQKIAIALAELVLEVKEVRSAQSKHENFGERLALCEQKIEAFHERLEGRPTRKKGTR